ncbi:MAG: cobyric acid synthase CobQ, partial [Cyanobacteria bacterium P01_A01_bin.17]
EIHQGQTQILDSSIVQPLFDDPTLGVVSLEHLTLGTYLHGLFDNGAWRRSWLNQIRCRRDLFSLPTDVPDYEEQRNQMFDQVTDAIAEHLDLTPLLALTSTDTH